MQNVKVDDSVLVSRYVNGDESAFSEILDLYQGRVFGYIMKLVRDEELANDVFQDTFVKVIKTIKSGKYNEEGKFLPWILRIAHNLVIDHFRKSNKMPKAGRGKVKDNEDFDIFSVLSLKDDNIEDEMIQQHITEKLHELITYLPEDQLEIVKLRHFVGMSFKDIAEMKDISINTALGRMRYALINLRKLMEENDISLTVY